MEHKNSKITLELVIFSLFVLSLILLSNNQAFGITIPVGHVPYHLAIDQNSHQVYVANNIDNTVSVIDGAPGSLTQNTVIATIPVGSGPVQVAVNSINHLVYTANFGSNTVSVINGSTNSLLDTIIVGNGPVSVAINPSTKILYASNLNAGTISVINATTNSIMTTINVAPGVARLTVDTTLNKIYATNFNSNKLYIINGSTNNIITTTTVGIAAGAIGNDPNNHRIFTTNFGSNTISVINGTTNAVTATIPVASGPAGIDLDTTTHRAYVASRTGNVVSIIADNPSSVNDNTVIGSISVTSPGAVAVDQTTHAVYVANRAVNTVTVLDISTKTPPTANAGPNQVVTVGTLVTLNGSKSSDPNGQNISFKWSQITGQTITLSNGTAMNPTFIAPNVNASQLLTFQLIVNDSTFSSSPSTVNIVVNPITTFVVPLNQSNAGTLLGGVNVGHIFNNLIISLLYTSNQTLSPSGHLLQTIIPPGINANNVSFNITESPKVPQNIPQPPIHTALYFTINSSGVDFSNPANFAKNLLPLTKFTVSRDSNSSQHFSDGCPVIPFDFFNVVTGQWNQFGVPVVENTNKIYVANSGASTLSIIDGSTNSVSTINLSSPLDGVTYDNYTNRIYVSNVNLGTLSVIDGATNNVIATIVVGTSPVEETIDPIMHHIYVVNKGSNTVSVIDDSTNNVIATIPVSGSPLALSVDPSLHKVYVGNYFSNTVSVINATTNSIITTIPADTPIGLAVDPNTHKVYVSDEFARVVSVINGTTNSIITTIPVGVNPYGIDINPNTNRVYVANIASNTVSVIDTSINAEIAAIPVGNEPISLKVNPNNGRIFVSNSLDNTVSVIDGLRGSPTENTVLSTIPVGNSPFRLFLNPNIPNPVRDPSTDIKDNSGNIVQCAYIAQHPHLSKFAVGGIIPALAIFGAGGGGEPGPSLGLSTSLLSTLPDVIKNSILHHDPFEPIAPSTDPSIPYPLSIDGKGYLLGGYSNTIQTVTEKTGAPVDLHMISQDGSPIQHVALYANLQGSSKDLYDSDTYIIYDEGQPLQIVDPHGFFSNVKFNIQDEGLQHKLTYTITFAKPMAKSDLDLRMWDESKHSSDTKIFDALQVVPDASQSNKDQVPANNILTNTTPTSPDQNSDLMPAIKDWGGYSSHPISDSEFLSDVGIKGHEIPHWAMKTTKWILDGEISPQDFANTLKYMEEKGILK